MRVLVCGSRDWDDRSAVSAALFGQFALAGDDPDVVVIEGGARGADACAAEWARNFASEHEQYPARWDKHGKAAGPIRNQQMLDEGKPEIVVAFKDRFQRDEIGATPRGGTEDMVRRAKAAGIPTYVISHA